MPQVLKRSPQEQPREQRAKLKMGGGGAWSLDATRPAARGQSAIKALDSRKRLAPETATSPWSSCARCRTFRMCCGTCAALDRPWLLRFSLALGSDEGVGHVEGAGRVGHGEATGAGFLHDLAALVDDLVAINDARSRLDIGAEASVFQHGRRLEGAAAALDAQFQAVFQSDVADVEGDLLLARGQTEGRGGGGVVVAE